MITIGFAMVALIVGYHAGYLLGCAKTWCKVRTTLALWGVSEGTVKLRLHMSNRRWWGS